MSIKTNLTYQILQHARDNGYAVPGVCVYNLEGVMATIRAAERCHSPAMIQLFPWAMHFYGSEFVKLVHDLAHKSSSPVSVHLDHCLKEADAELALGMSFDSMMIDGSAFEDESAGLAYCQRMTKKAIERGMTIEAEIGRIEGGEDGLPTTDLEEILTQPEEAARFIETTGAQYLAPSFGNVHGNYGPRGPQWDKPRLAAIREELGDKAFLVLHGTHGVDDTLFKEAVGMGFSKININKSCRERCTEFLVNSAGRVELTQQISEGVQIYSEEIEHYMRLFGSAGKSWK